MELVERHFPRLARCRQFLQDSSAFLVARRKLDQRVSRTRVAFRKLDAYPRRARVQSLLADEDARWSLDGGIMEKGRRGGEGRFAGSGGEEGVGA